MGGCLALRVNQRLKTQISQFSSEKGLLSFTIMTEQWNPKEIKGVMISILQPFSTIQFPVTQIYAQRKLVIPLWTLSLKQPNVLLPHHKVIQFRISFLYENYRSTPTPIFTSTFNPVCSLEFYLQFPNQKLLAQKNKLKQQILQFSNPSALYYQGFTLNINVLLLGAINVGKSNFIHSLSSILHKNPIRPQIGNKLFQKPTTSSIQTYQIVSNRHRRITIVDSPGTHISIPDISHLYTAISDNQDYKNIIHTAIVFINPFNKESLPSTLQLIQFLVLWRIEYQIAIINSQSITPLYEDYYSKKTHQLIKETLKKTMKLQPLDTRMFPVNNLLRGAECLAAEVGILQCFKSTLELGVGYYHQHPPLHFLYESKVIDIRHDIDINMELKEVLQSVQLAQLVYELSGKLLNKMYVTRNYGKQGDRGYNLIEKELEIIPGRAIKEFITIKDNFKCFQVYNSAPFLATVIV